MTTLDLSPYFSNAPTQWELVGTWPTGLSITSSGVVSGTTTDSGLFAGVQVRCKNDHSDWAYSNTFDVHASKFAALVPNVNYEMKGVEIGTGGLTTTHTSSLYAPDYEGVYREFGANEPVWSGAYSALPQYFTESNAFDIWNYNNGGTITKTQNAVGVNGEPNSAWTLTDTESGSGSKIGHRITSRGGASFTWRVWVKKDLTSPTFCFFDFRIGTSAYIQLRFNQATGQDQYVGSAQISTVVRNIYDKGDYWLYVVYTGNSASNVTNRFMYIYPANGLTSEWPSPSAQTGSVVIDNVEMFGSYAVSPGGENNAKYQFIAPVYNTTVGDSGSSPVYTWWALDPDTGTPLAEMPYLQYYPAAQNELLYSNDMADAYWVTSGSPVVTQDQVGLSGEPNTASLISGVQNDYVRNWSVQTVDGVYTVKVWIKKDATQTAGYVCTVRAQGQSSNESYVTLNPADGTFNEQQGGADAIEVIDDGDWWILLIESTVAPVGYMRYYFFPVGSIPTIAGAATVGQAEVHSGKTIAQVRGLGPIFTTTAAVSTDETLYTFSDANNDDDVSAYMCEYAASEAYITGTQMFSLSNTTRLSSLQTSLSNNNAISNDRSMVATTWPINRPLIMAGCYSWLEGSQALYSSGSWSATSTPETLSKSGTITLMRYLTPVSAGGISGQMRNLTRWAAVDFNAGVTALNTKARKKLIVSASMRAAASTPLTSIPIDYDRVGSGWQIISGGFTNIGGDTPSAYLAATTAGWNFASIDLGVSDFEVTMRAHSVDSERRAIAFRIVDSNNYWALQLRDFELSIITVELIEYVAGTPTVKQSGTFAGPDSFDSGTFCLNAVCNGTDITWQCGKATGEVVTNTYTSSTHQTATKAGFKIYDFNRRMTVFEAWDI